MSKFFNKQIKFLNKNNKFEIKIGSKRLWKGILWKIKKRKAGKEKWNHGIDAMKRFEEIKKLHEHFACGHEEIDDLIQMVDLLIKRNSIEKRKFERITNFLKRW